jgi:RNA polymerase sigma-70 factor (ECF subfamily)
MTTTCCESTVDLILGEQPYLRSFARRLVRCESDADDLVQDTLLRAYHARDRFRPGTSVRAWTTTILRRLFISGANRARRRRLQTDTDSGGALDAAVGRSPAPYDEAASNMDPFDDRLDDELRRALGRVPEVYRTTFLLAAVRDLSCEEIGRELSVPAGTVMSRIHRARQRLRVDLGRTRRGPHVPLRRRRTGAGASSAHAPTASAART